MPTAEEMLPPPEGPTGPPQGAEPGGGFPSPAPAQPDQGAMQKLQLVRQIVTATRMLANMVPGAVPEVRQINDLCQKLQAKIVQSQQAPEPAAPPG